MLEMESEGVDKGFVLTSLRHFIDGLELDFSRMAVEFERSQQWEQEGYNSAADWMRFNCHLNSYAVWNALAVGEQEGRLDQSIEAMKAREIGFAHLATMGRTAEERSLRLSTAQDGCLLLHGVLDPVGGAALRTALEPLAQPSGAHDDRNRDQRYADALVELASAGKPANLQVTATIETLKGLAGAAGAEMEFSLPISSISVQRMACDCSVTRVLLSQDSMPVDVGRSKRVISVALGRALKARDGNCKWPTCERSASMCDGHHLMHWIDGGPTDLDNLVLLCRRHHRMVHEGGWQLIKTEHQE